MYSYETYYLAVADLWIKFANNIASRDKDNVNIEDMSLSAYSWTIENQEPAYKVLDKSAFLHWGTGIPIDIRPFFIGN
jgi:hypothetical protein